MKFNIISRVKNTLQTVAVKAIEKKDAVVSALNALIIGFFMSPVSVYADGLGKDSLQGLQKLLEGLAGAIGAVLIVYGGIRFAIAFQKMDQNGEHSAIYTILAGIILASLTAAVNMIK